MWHYHQDSAIGFFFFRLQKAPDQFRPPRASFRSPAQDCWWNRPLPRIWRPCDGPYAYAFLTAVWYLSSMIGLENILSYTTWYDYVTTSCERFTAGRARIPGPCAWNMQVEFPQLSWASIYAQNTPLALLRTNPRLTRHTKRCWNRTNFSCSSSVPNLLAPPSDKVAESCWVQHRAERIPRWLPIFYRVIPRAPHFSRSLFSQSEGLRFKWNNQKQSNGNPQIQIIQVCGQDDIHSTWTLTHLYTKESETNCWIC